MMKPIIFFTPPTTKIAKEFKIENVIFNIWHLRKYPYDIRKCYYAKRVLLDAGICPLFERQNKGEYPKNFLDNYHYYALQFARKIRENNPNLESIWVVIPDYPADLPNNLLSNNVEKTVKNWLRFKDIDTKGLFEWMPSLQAKRKDFESFKFSIEKFKEIFGEDYPIVAIGSVCKWKDVRLIEAYCKIAREELPNQWIHAFGPTVKALPYIWRYINSFDSITTIFHVRNSKGAMDVWKRYVKKFERLEYYGSLLRVLRNEIFQV